MSALSAALSMSLELFGCIKTCKAETRSSQCSMQYVEKCMKQKCSPFVSCCLPVTERGIRVISSGGLVHLLLLSTSIILLHSMPHQCFQTTWTCSALLRQNTTRKLFTLSNDLRSRRSLAVFTPFSAWPVCVSIVAPQTVC